MIIEMPPVGGENDPRHFTFRAAPRQDCSGIDLGDTAPQSGINRMQAGIIADSTALGYMGFAVVSESLNVGISDIGIVANKNLGDAVY